MNPHLSVSNHDLSVFVKKFGENVIERRERSKPDVAADPVRIRTRKFA
jgi:hypothetical protein